MTAERSRSPERVLAFEDDAGQPLGYLVIDTFIHGKTCGGLRILPDVSVEEVKQLARSMTLKFGFVGKPMGGAKAGCVMPLDCSKDQRRARLHLFGQKISTYLKNGTYFMGTDMGCTAEDLQEVYGGAGIKFRAQAEGIRSGFYTSLTVMVCIEAAALLRNIDLSKASIAVEGFGTVGSSVARVMTSRKGVKMVALSTSAGGLYDANGLNVEKLLSLKNQFGEACVHHYDRTKEIPKEEVPFLKADIFSPCARQETIHEANAINVQAQIVCGGANYPVSTAAEPILCNHGVLSIPHFIASSGGVIGGRLEMARLDDDFIEAYIRKNYLHTIRSIIEQSQRRSEPVITTAERYALNQCHLMKQTAKKGTRPFLRKVLCRLVDHGIMPASLRKQTADLYFGCMSPSKAAL